MYKSHRQVKTMALYMKRVKVGFKFFRSYRVRKMIFWTDIWRKYMTTQHPWTKTLNVWVYEETWTFVLRESVLYVSHTFSRFIGVLLYHHLRWSLHKLCKDMIPNLALYVKIKGRLSRFRVWGSVKADLAKYKPGQGCFKEG